MPGFPIFQSHRDEKSRIDPDFKAELAVFVDVITLANNFVEDMDGLKDEQELLGFTVSGHPLDLFPSIQWEKYCPIAALDKHFGERVKICGLTFADRIAHQEDGQSMKFISLCDYTGFVETKLFATVYKAFGMETIKSPIIEVEGFVEAFENKMGYTLRVLKVTKP